MGLVFHLLRVLMSLHGFDDIWSNSSSALLAYVLATVRLYTEH
jgi:hypothetical protein